MKRLGIHFRLLLAAFTLITITTLALGYMGTKITRQFVQERFEKRISFLVRYLALNSELGILLDDRSMLERPATNLLSETDVVGVTILDELGQNLVHVSKEGPREFSIMETSVFLRESMEESRAFEWNVDTELGQKAIGTVRIAYSTQGLDEMLKTMRDRFIWLSIGFAALAGIIFFFLSRSLVSPVTLLAGAAREVAGGDLDLRVDPGNLPETRELALAFNAMLDSLEKNRRALQEADEEMMRQSTLAEMGKFSLMVAHEVKNPLSIIKSSLDVLKGDLKSDNTMVFYMEDEIRRLNRLIEDFLVFARPTRPVLRQADVNDLLREIVVRFDLQQTETGVSMETQIPDTPCLTRVDPDLLTRAISNVLRNAAEANGESGMIMVKAACDKDFWTAEILDEGEGIPRESLHRIFEPFFTTRSKGTGLGLAYASQVIRYQGGAISAENRKEGGARFLVEIPMAGRPTESTGQK